MKVTFLGFSEISTFNGYQTRRIKIMQNNSEKDQSSEKTSSSEESKDSKIIELETVSDKNRFFHRVKTDHPKIKQKVTVNVRVEQPKDDCLTALFRCFGSAKP